MYWHWTRIHIRYGECTCMGHLRFSFTEWSMCCSLSLCAVCAFAFLVQFILLFFIHTEFRTTAFLPVVHYTDMIDSSATKCLSIQMPKYLHERHTTELLRITMAQILLFCVSIKLVKMFLHESNITTGSYVIFVCFEPFQRNNLLVCRHDNERSGLFISSYHWLLSDTSVLSVNDWK